jgi:hypothetical protein
MSHKSGREIVGQLDLSQAVLVSPSGLSGPERKAVTMLIEEVEKRTLIRWTCTEEWPAEPVPVVAIGPASALADFAGPYSDELAREGDTSAAEGYRIRTGEARGTPAVLVIGNDARGVLYGAGHLLRNLRMGRDRIALPGDLEVTTAPHYGMRGYNMGYGDLSNTYGGWDLPQWEQYLRDLIVFGVNTLRLSPSRWDSPRSKSVHQPLPPRQMMPALSRLADEYGIDFALSCAALDGDYADPAVVDLALSKWGEVFEQTPRLDAVFTAGGDPGHTQPKVLMPFLGKLTATLRRFHPGAEMWVSPQGFSQEWMDEFVGILQRDSPDWLTGVIHGPWVHTTTAQLCELIPDKYPIQNYPDITHCLSCQFPMPDWDIAYALTEGREPINPRPRGQITIFARSEPATIGHVAYSEGCHDDVNKFVWSALSWDPEVDVVEVLREYSRYFIGDRYTDDFAQGLLALERNWEGPLATNGGVYSTLQQFQAMEEAASPWDLKNWRFQQGLYRAYYDAYIRSRLLYEMGLEAQAMGQLQEARAKGSLVAMAEAERILDRAETEPIARGWRTRIHQLAEALFQSIHMQLAVRLYQGMEEVRGANLDGVDYPLNDRPWLKAQFAEIRQLSDEEDRLKAIQEVVDWENPGPGGFYEAPGCSFHTPHVVKGPGFAEDPGYLVSPLRRYPYRKDKNPVRVAWRGYVGMLNDQPLPMRYTGLDPEAEYKIRVVYSAEKPEIKVRLDANGDIEVHPYIHKPPQQGPVEFDIPQEATRGGTLELAWRREQGKGGSGIGCDISEVWLIKK